MAPFRSHTSRWRVLLFAFLVLTVTLLPSLLARTVYSSHYTILLSSSPDRSGSMSLDDKTVSGDIYVFTSPDEGVQSEVDFFVDGSFERREKKAPYDLAGTIWKDPSKPARPFDTTNLSDGSHTLAAEMSTAEGPQIVSATFTVANPESTEGMTLQQQNG